MLWESQHACFHGQLVRSHRHSTTWQTAVTNRESGVDGGGTWSPRETKVGQHASSCIIRIELRGNQATFTYQDRGRSKVRVKALLARMFAQCSRRREALIGARRECNLIGLPQKNIERAGWTRVRI
jgi:hypothetical protein